MLGVDSAGLPSGNNLRALCHRLRWSRWVLWRIPPSSLLRPCLACSGMNSSIPIRLSVLLKGMLMQWCFCFGFCLVFLIFNKPMSVCNLICWIDYPWVLFDNMELNIDDRCSKFRCSSKQPFNLLMAWFILSFSIAQESLVDDYYFYSSTVRESWWYFYPKNI